MPLNLFYSNSSAFYANIVVSKNYIKYKKRNKENIFTFLLSCV